MSNEEIIQFLDIQEDVRLFILQFYLLASKEASLLQDVKMIQCVFLRKKIEVKSLLHITREKKCFKKIKFQYFYLAVHMKNIYGLHLFTGFLKFSYSALFKWRQALTEIIKGEDRGSTEVQTTRI